MATLDCREMLFSNHAFLRLFEREIYPGEVAEIVHHAEIIEERPDDLPFPSFLLLGSLGGRPIHIAVAREADTDRCRIITLYWPDPARWDDDFRIRRR